MMSCSRGDPNSRPTSQAPGEEEALGWEVSRDREVATIEKIACDRCRQRKTKCDRAKPCKQCVKTGVQCSYKSGHKAKEKRQRVLISTVYERRLEHISNKIDELGAIIGRLSDGRQGIPTRVRVQSPSSLQASGFVAQHQPLTQAEGIESNLFAHVTFATEALQTVLRSDPYFNEAAESALETLCTRVSIQKQQNEVMEASRPFPNVLPHGCTFKDLPIPSLDRIMACLRIAQESSPSQLYWPFEFGSLGDFTQYVIKACSPGPITDMELIIVHYVLYWLFTQCSIGAEDEAMKQDYETQAGICQGSLETILSNIPFHIDTNVDSIRALYMATTHCLHHGKPCAAWTFISRASLMCQALGFHSSHSLATERPGVVQHKMHLFWVVYVLEKAVALRLGRPSTIRDQDITVSRLALDRKMASLAYNRLPDWIDVAALYGRLYDDLYCPKALAQPYSIRAARTVALASEFERMIAARSECYNQPNQWSSHMMNPSMSNFIVHANRALEYSTLASIYRGFPSERSSSLSPCPQCIAAARISLKETTACIAILLDRPTWPLSLDLWVNEILLLAPFMPFLILICNIVEAKDGLDLDSLRQLIDGLRLLAQYPRYSGCNRQLRIFEALYNVVSMYIEAKARMRPEDPVGAHFTHLDTETDPNDGIWIDSTSLPGSSFPVQLSDGHPETNIPPLQFPMLNDLNTEIDPSTLQLESWIHPIY
ncbi:hypothetical protein BJX68DRAFT_198610 [Aspergillus pseudodeflectus]|uniref:Zn(2)-C6 fungal-type domain-containing protein n=1 Tax=Aspergillus pseudodeflectus TaxID=176178 RepID=A0ABR4JKH2_9EURO